MAEGRREPARWRDWLAVPGLMAEAAIRHLPGPAGDRVRYRYWKRRLGHLGRNVRISEGAHFQNPQHVRIGDDAWIDRNVLVLAGAPRSGRATKVKPNDPFPLQPGEVSIGRGVHVSPHCVLSGLWGLYVGDYAGLAANVLVYSYSGHYRNLADEKDPRQFSYSPRAPPDRQAMIASPVYIGDHVGIAPFSVVLPGSRLERGTWVGPGTVVKGRWGPQTLVTQGPDGLREKPLGQGLVLPEPPVTDLSPGPAAPR